MESNSTAKGVKGKAVFALSRPSRCYGCDKRQLPGDLVRLKDGKDEREVLCRACAKLDAFVVVPAGNAKITRLAKKKASECYVILHWSDLWKTYERKGLLIDKDTAGLIESETGVKLCKQ